ncbi:MAG: hypoxanthine phosphoribosyltransferase [Fimbriimonadia bacterium]|nr:hypoxanthine phosphoribosyltransferase [Fimbriimonadia bacterium]
MSTPYQPDIVDRIWLPAEQIQQRVLDIAQQIERDYDGAMPHLVTVMKGGIFFMTDLARALTLPHTLDFLSIARYGPHVQSGEVRITKDLDEPISGRHVLILEDIVDTGMTLGYIYKNLERRKPASLKVCILLDRPRRRLVDVPIAYKGFDAPDEFLVGYGLDWREQCRNLPYVGILKPELTMEGSL